MGRKVPPGLILRGNTWHIQKAIAGERIRESCQTSDLAEAERYLAHRMEAIRLAKLYGVRPTRTFREAATKYLKEADKASLRCDGIHLEKLDPFIGNLALEAVHMGALQPYIEARRYRKLKDGTMKKTKARTINYALQVVRHILNLAAGEWMDERGLTWLAHAPKIRLLREDDKKEPFPLSWDEQERLFAELPDYLRCAALFTVNTGCRDQEVCNLLWEWERPVPELDTSVFVIPPRFAKDRNKGVKNRMPRLVVLNKVAAEVVEEERGVHPTHVFSHDGRPLYSIYGTVWKNARKRVGLPDVRVHDLKHSFGCRLRAAGVNFEDRQDLLGHKSSRITTHYSAPELRGLITASNAVCTERRHKTDTAALLRPILRVVGSN